MPIFDKLKSIFVVSEDATATGKEEPIQDTQTQNGSIKEADSNTNIITPGQTSEKFIEILHQVLEKNNLPGFDYLEYRKAIQSIAKMHNMDEAAQFRTAFAAAQAMNVQPNVLVDSAKKYLNLLQTEETNFNNSANQFLTTQVSAKENELHNIQNSIKTKEEQIEILKKELESSHNRLVSLKSEIENAKQKVETNKSNFKASYLTVIDQIKSDIQKMETYLK
ncbi:MAG: hypothetical protein WBB26_08880 [Saprospiraceae bacterium]